MNGAFDAVTCSHAFYELKGDTQDQALQEIVRVLRPGGNFLMMEHDVPANPFVRALFYLRLTFIGAGQAIDLPSSRAGSAGTAFRERRESGRPRWEIQGHDLPEMTYGSLLRR